MVRTVSDYGENTFQGRAHLPHVTGGRTMTLHDYYKDILLMERHSTHLSYFPSKSAQLDLNDPVTLRIFQGAGRLDKTVLIRIF